MPSPDAPSPPAASTSTAAPAVYLPPTSVAPPPDLPDSAYDLTPTEAQSVLAGIAKRARDDSVLRTGRMRERDAAPARRWDETKIRIKFADQTLVQQAFPSTAPLADVYAFVRSALAPAHADAAFTLYIPPNQLLPERPPPPLPRSKLPPHKRNAPPLPPKLSLADHGLAPSSVLSIRFAQAELNGSDVAAPLRADLLAKAEELPVPGAGGPPAPAPTAAPMTAAGVGEGGEKAEPAKAGGGKMPKWFKGPGKK